MSAYPHRLFALFDFDLTDIRFLEQFDEFFDFANVRECSLVLGGMGVQRLENSRQRAVIAKAPRPEITASAISDM